MGDKWMLNVGDKFMAAWTYGNLYQWTPEMVTNSPRPQFRSANVNVWTGADGWAIIGGMFSKAHFVMPTSATPSEFSKYGIPPRVLACGKMVSPVALRTDDGRSRCVTCAVIVTQAARLAGAKEVK